MILEWNPDRTCEWEEVGGGENDAISVIENQREWETGEFWD
jgi:hypothetical protein